MYIGIDIGGTNIRLASASNLDNPIFENRKQFRNSHSFDKNFQNILSYIDSLSSKVDGISISIAGTTDDDKSMVIEGNNIPEFSGKPTKELLIDRYKCKVMLDNDGIVMARGEALYCEGKNIDFAYLIWGTGIGGASVKYKNNKPVITKFERRRDTNLATWEDVCGGKSIEKFYKKPAETLDENEWREVMKHFLQNISEFISIVKPKMIIFGGGIAVGQSSRIARISDQLSTLTIKVTSLANDAGLFGAMASLKKS